jgi:transcriptional regulator with XRE-family HTH domain
MTPERLQLAGELAAVRTLAGLDQRELARRLGMSQSRICRIEAGQIVLPDGDLRAWLEATGAEHRLEGLRRLNEAAHRGGGAARVALTVTDDGVSQIRIRGHRAELTVVDPAVLVRIRALLDQIVGAAMSTPSTDVAVRPDTPGP